MEQSGFPLSLLANLLAALGGGYYGGSSAPVFCPAPVVAATDSHTLASPPIYTAAPVEVHTGSRGALDYLLLAVTLAAGFLLGWSARGCIHDWWFVARTQADVGATVGSIPVRPLLRPGLTSGHLARSVGSSGASERSSISEGAEDDVQVWRSRRRPHDL